MSDHNWNERGILTDSDVAYLFGESQIAKGTEFNVRRRIRSRALLGIADFSVILRHLSERDRELMFDLPELTPEQRAGGVDPDNDVLRGLSEVPSDEEIAREREPGDYVIRGMRDAMTLFYLGLQHDDPHNGHEHFENLVAAAVKQGIEEDGTLADVEVSIDVTEFDETAAEVHERLLEGDDELTEAETKALVQSEPDVIMKLFKERGILVDDEQDSDADESGQ